MRSSYCGGAQIVKSSCPRNEICGAQNFRVEFCSILAKRLLVTVPQLCQTKNLSENIFQILYCLVRVFS